MTRNLSLREFAKRERANSWQSKGKFAFKFMDCHAVFCEKNCSQRRVKRQSLRFVLCGDDLAKNLYPKSALLKVISSKKTF